MNPENLKVGMKVRFHPIIGGKHDGNVYTVRGLGRLPDGVDVVQLEEKRGWVAADAISPNAPGADHYGLMEGAS